MPPTADSHAESSFGPEATTSAEVEPAEVVREQRGHQPEQSSSSPATKRCPACAELVKAEATVCRFCSYDWRTNTLSRAARRTNGLAVASMVVGIVSLLIFIAAPVSLVGSVVALALGSRGSKQIARSDDLQTGKEMARAGVVLGLIALVISATVLILAAVAGIQAISFDVTAG